MEAKFKDRDSLKRYIYLKIWYLGKDMMYFVFKFNFKAMVFGFHDAFAFCDTRHSKEERFIQINISEDLVLSHLTL